MRLRERSTNEISQCMFRNHDLALGAIPRLKLRVRSWLVSDTDSLVVIRSWSVFGTNSKLKIKIMVCVQGYVQDYDVPHLRWWLIQVGMSLMHVVHLTTNLDLLEEEVPTELKVLLTLTGTLTSLLKHTTEDPAPGCLSRRRIVKMIYFKLWVLYFHIRNPCAHMLPNMLPIA